MGRRLASILAAMLFCVLDTPAGAGQLHVTPPFAPAVLTLPEAGRFLGIGSDELERLARRNENPAWRFARVALLVAEAANAHAFKAEDLEKLKETGRCIKCDLSGAKLNVANLPGVNLSGADLSRASLTGADLSRANLTGADLAEVLGPWCQGKLTYMKDDARGSDGPIPVRLPANTA